MGSSAAEHATLRIPRASPAETAADVRAALEDASFDSASEVAVVDGEQFFGLIPMHVLLAAPPEAEASALADTDVPSVLPETSEEIAASAMAEHRRGSVAVVDEAGRFHGLLPPGEMLSVLLNEHEEDLARIGGFRAGSGRARQAAEETVSRRLRHRLPWLLVGLLGAMASAILLGSFEEEIESTVILAFFLPAVVYMADAVGTQTEAILIRGLAVGVAIRQVFMRELVSGAVTGAVVGLAFMPFVLIGWGKADVAVGVSVALFASCSIATLVAMTLPWLFQRLGVDPAFGSGPLATVIQDLLSIAAYLAIAVPIAT